MNNGEYVKTRSGLGTALQVLGVLGHLLNVVILTSTYLAIQAAKEHAHGLDLPPVVGKSLLLLDFPLWTVVVLVLSSLTIISTHIATCVRSAASTTLNRIDGALSITHFVLPMLIFGFTGFMIVPAALTVFFASAMIIPMESNTLRMLRPFYMTKMGTVHYQVGTPMMGMQQHAVPMSPVNPYGMPGQGHSPMPGQGYSPAPGYGKH
jgi:hypothetical protein